MSPEVYLGRPNKNQLKKEKKKMASNSVEIIGLLSENNLKEGSYEKMVKRTII